MQGKKIKGFYEPRKKSFKIERDTVEIPSSMPMCHYHNYYEFYYLKSGKRYYFIKDKTYLISAGTAVLINKYVIHSTETYENAAYDRILFNFSDDYIEGLLSALGEPSLISEIFSASGIVKLSEEILPLFESILFSMLTEYERCGGTDSPFLKCSVLELLMLLRAQGGSLHRAEDVGIKLPHQTVSEIIGYINNNYFDDINLESICERFYISPSHFSRIFKRVSGCGFTEYVNNVRIKEALRLVKETDMSITEIAAAVGYKSITHFGRVFQKTVGVSPTEYRKRR